MKFKLLLSILILFAAKFSFADSVTINQFVIKENPFAKDEIAIVATDTAKNIQENVNGVFTFTLNGFQEQLNFQNGTAFYRHKIDKSSFLYVKHKNDTGTHSMLYYIYKHDSKLDPFRISWFLLLVIPVALILFAYVFKRFLIFAIIILCIFIYFNYHNGLSIPTFFESILDGLKNLF